MEVVEFPVEGDGRVYVQVVGGEFVEDGELGLSRAGAGDRIARAAVATWEQALAGMHVAAEGALNQLRRIEPAPEEVKVTFGVAVNGKLGATLVSAGSEAHLKVEVVWKNPAASGGEQG
ncbi:CU044_2847 family protein [Amycolatopsis pigmentata]|uniref:CU044_2847 family protein n=1 Tax=Amycolatopsis pigmentata TaxID=450801 RepID=A0ABW5G5N8_9PSEU